MPESEIAAEQPLDNPILYRRFYELYRTLREIKGEIQELEGKFGIPMTHAAVLYLLAQDGPMSLSQLATKLHVRPANLLYIIDHLEAIGQVERVSSDTDARVKILRVCKW